MGSLTVALTGNPNTGKSTIFNEITGARQKIGNWPGVTVDKKMGWINHDGRAISVVDLPGTYSINARSPEEKIVVEYLDEEKPDLVVNVVDMTNIERNLFLTIQLLEKGVPLLIDLNMEDEAKKNGVKVNVRELEKSIGMPVTTTNAHNSESVKGLLSIFTSVVMSSYEPSARLKEHILKVNEIKNDGKGEVEERLAILRYSFIDEIMAKAVTFEKKGWSLNDKIDSILANGIFALPLLFVMMYAVFEITFNYIGQPMADYIDEFIADTIIPWAGLQLDSMAVSEWVKSLVIDGIIGGVGGIMTFVPLIFTLFFCIFFLDGTGYMARVAFVMDSIMHRAGLSGKGVMQLVMAFGCAVPAIMGARTLDSEKDRMISIMVTPFMLCGAKLPIMALFAAMFFPENASNVVFSMYITGILAAILMAKILSATTFKDEESSFLLELPPYRMPNMKTVLLETWDKGKGYLIKAGTIILAMSVVIWFLANFNSSGMTTEANESFLAVVGSAMSKLFVFHGFATWEAGAATITGILAKEAVVSMMGILYGVAEVSTEVDEAFEAAAQLSSTMGTAFTAASALAFMVFTQLYTPCVTVLGTIKKETASWKWTLFSAVYTFVVAWVISLIVYQIACIIGF